MSVLLEKTPIICYDKQKQKRSFLLMNKWLRALCIGATATAMLTVSAFAADFTSCADRLKDMGLFLGTNNGYELERAPTRAEAAVMLVRLLGQEKVARSLSYTAPFADLQDWQKPYVQYLYDAHLTTGATADTFAPAEPCTAQMYATFLLRALGYNNTDDFTYADALSFAEEKGLSVKTLTKDDDFLRDHVVASSYIALSLPRKGEDILLLDSLQQTGAVDTEKAMPYQDLFHNYYACSAACAAIDNLSAVSLRHEWTATIKDLTLQNTERIMIDRQIPAQKTTRETVLTRPDEDNQTIATEIYLADQKYYWSQNNNAYYQTLTEKQFKQLFTGCATPPLITVDTLSCNDNTYVITYDATGMDEINQFADALQGTLGHSIRLQINDMKVQYTVTDGNLTEQKISYSFQSDAGNGAVESEMILDDSGETVTAVSYTHLTLPTIYSV